MLQDGYVVVAGVSGGADSVCLLFLLCELASKGKIALEVVHVNHMIREEASDDCEFVRNLCRQFEERFGIEIRFHEAKADVRKLADENGISTEEAGRLVRYDAFRKVLAQRRGVIAVAHNANDRAETMLFNLFRGTGLRGIVGILPVNGDIIRPLLCVNRESIERFLNEEGISYVIDKTNLEDDYTRNKIRHNILNYATENISGKAVENMTNAANQVLSAEEYIDECAVKAAIRCTLEKEIGKIVINIEELKKEHPYIQSRVVYDAVSYVAGKRKDISGEHIRSVLNLLGGEGTKWINLIYGIKARKEYSRLIILKENSYVKSFNPEDEKSKVTMEVLTAFSPDDIPKENYTKWFDYDKISSVATVRNRKEGDYLVINKDMQTKSLQDYMVNEKIPKDKRDETLLLADGNHVMWVIGGRISEYYKVSEKTERVLEVKYEGEN